HQQRHAVLLSFACCFEYSGASRGVFLGGRAGHGICFLLEMSTRATALLAAILLSACNDVPIERSTLTHERYAELLEGAGAGDTLLGRRWLEAARAALREPMAVTLPYAEAGAFLAHQVVANGYAFEALEGQKLSVELATSGPDSGEAAGTVYA